MHAHSLRMAQATGRESPSSPPTFAARAATLDADLGLHFCYFRPLVCALGSVRASAGGGGFVNQNKAKFVSSAAARAANGEVKVGKGGAAVFMHRSARAFLARSPGDRQGIPWRGFLPSDTLFLRKDFLNRLGWRARISYVPTCFAI